MNHPADNGRPVERGENELLRLVQQAPAFSAGLHARGMRGGIEFMCKAALAPDRSPLIYANARRTDSGGVPLPTAQGSAGCLNSLRCRR